MTRPTACSGNCGTTPRANCADGGANAPTSDDLFAMRWPARGRLEASPRAMQHGSGALPRGGEGPALKAGPNMLRTQRRRSSSLQRAHPRQRARGQNWIPFTKQQVVLGVVVGMVVTGVMATVREAAAATDDHCLWRTRVQGASRRQRPIVAWPPRAATRFASSAPCAACAPRSATVPASRRTASGARGIVPIWAAARATWAPL